MGTYTEGKIDGAVAEFAMIREDKRNAMSALFDEDYYSICYSGGCARGDEREVQLTVSMSF